MGIGIKHILGLILVLNLIAGVLLFAGLTTTKSAGFLEPQSQVVLRFDLAPQLPYKLSP